MENERIDRLNSLREQKSRIEAEIAAERAVPSDPMGDAFPFGPGFGRKGMSAKGAERLFNRHSRDLANRASAAETAANRRANLASIEDEIARLEAGGKTNSEQATDRRERIENEAARRFVAIKIGDTFTPGNDALVVTRANRYSITAGGCNWSAGEVTGLHSAAIRAAIDRVSPKS